MKRCPAAEGVVIASNCSAAMSRTSTKLKPKRGNAGIEPSRSFLTASIEAEKSDPRTGPRTRAGLTVTSSSAPPSALCHAHAARSAIVLDRP